MTVMVTAKNSDTLLPLHTFPPVGLSHLGRLQSPRQLRAYRNSRLAGNCFYMPRQLLSRERFLCDKTVSVPKRNFHKRLEGKLRVFFLDVNPLCYRGAKPSLPSFANWLSLFFSEVSIRNPVIAVLDGEDGNGYRRQLLPSYKEHRRKFIRHWQELQISSIARVSSNELQITDVLHKCNVPVGEKF
ncbi:uncharacterized protein LOC110114291 [Dendrobium catenatum]|uniref:Shikimate kinase-like protein n=1 Tax=Dendrobium nobile TaxID=94219 RepID=A0A7T0FXK6_DENNO|nr:uncharacterized protein LOC110114291 [Dendrobium catenatum]QPJ58208.1 shikimate kinase-like protein [Dendrobium nobile]